ncbi:MAG: phosphatase PAP2 family protein [Methylococcaceae bacterium]|nr:phosphatase PAP2 family protein [Methylococcaceae bacterium]
MKLLYSIHKYDVFMFTWLINTRIHSALTQASRYISKTGDGSLYLLIAGFLFWYKGIESPLLQAVLLAFLIERPVYFILKNGLKRNRPEAALQKIIPLYCWAALVGCSRVVLGVHFPTDILVGLLLGISVALFSLGQI